MLKRVALILLENVEVWIFDIDNWKNQKPKNQVPSGTEYNTKANILFTPFGTQAYFGSIFHS